MSEHIPRAYGALAIALILWAGAFPATRYALGALQPEHLMVVRFTLASLVTLAWALYRGMGKPRQADFGVLLFIGVVAVFFYQIAFNYGMRAISSGPAAAIVDTAPIFAALLSAIFLRERIGVMSWSGMILGVLGVAIIALGEGGEFIFEPAAFLLLAAAFLFAINVVMQKPLLSRYRVADISFWTLFLGTLPMLIFAPGAAQVLADLPNEIWIAVIYLALFPAALGGILWNYALTHLPVARVSSSLYLLPPITFLVAWMTLGEVPSAASLLGALLALIGVALVQWPVLASNRKS